MSDFTNTELRRLDLTLLLVFLGVVRHRKASAVAVDLGLTQSGVSQALKRLRDIFGDELFLRRPYGLEPTATALALEEPVQRAVESLRGALGAARAFEPGTTTDALRIAALDAEQAVVIPKLAARVASEAPGMRLSVVPLGRTAAIEALAEGRVDIAVGFIWERPASIRSETLYEEGFLVAGPASALPKSPRLTLDAYCAATHVLVSPGGDLRGIVDETLDRLGRSRRVATALSAFLPALAVCRVTGSLVTIPTRVARTFARDLGLVTAEPPLQIRSFPVSAFWHKRDDHDPRLGWVREVLRDIER